MENLESGSGSDTDNSTNIRAEVSVIVSLAKRMKHYERLQGTGCVWESSKTLEIPIITVEAET